MNDAGCDVFDPASPSFLALRQVFGGRDDATEADTVPTLVLGGDRDELSPVEDCVPAYRHLPAGRLHVLPDTGHEITRAKVDAMLSFLT